MSKKQPIPFELSLNERLVINLLPTVGSTPEQFKQLDIQKKIAVNQQYLDKVKAYRRLPKVDDPNTMERVPVTTKTVGNGSFIYEPQADDFTVNFSDLEHKTLLSWVKLTCEISDKKELEPDPILVKLYWRLIQ